MLAGLAEGLTVSAIGEQLGMGHSSVSKALHVAETRAGFKLVEQRGRRIYLTASGHVLAQRAQHIVRDVDELNHLADGVRAGSEGLLRITSSATPADYLLPPIVGAFLREYPNVRLVLRVSALSDLHHDLASGEFDIGIGPPIPSPSGWQFEPLYDDEMLFVVAPGSPLAGRPSMTWSELRQHLLIGQFREPHWSHMWMTLTQRPFDVERTVELRTAEATKRLVAEGEGVGIIPRSAVVRELSEGALKALDVTDVPRRIPYAVFTRAGWRPPPVEQRFRDLLKQRLGSRE